MDFGTKLAVLEFACIGLAVLGLLLQSLYTLNILLLFTLDALALSVIATAMWLAGWLGGWLTHSGIVSKRLNLSENFFDHLKAPSL